MSEMTTGPGTARVALVTGAASGIGAAIASTLRERGLRLVLLDRDPAVAGVARGLDAAALVADVADAAAVAAAIGALPALDVLVNCAAFAPVGGVDAPDAAGVLTRTLAVNVGGMVATTAAAIGLLRRSAAPRILNISSIQGAAAGADSLAYATSKGAVDALTRSLAVDLAPDGVLVNALAPGFVATPMALLPDGTSEHDADWFRTIYVEHGRIPLRRPAGPAEIAEAAEFLVSERNSYVTGAVLVADGGLLATF